MIGPRPDPLLTFERLAALEKAVRRLPGCCGDLRRALEAIAALPAGEPGTAERARDIARVALDGDAG